MDYRMKVFKWFASITSIVIYRFLFFSFLTFLIVSCANRALVENLVIYPDPPDTARIQYLTSISSSKEIEKNRGLLQKYILGEKPPKKIYKPYGAAFYRSKIFICDLDLEGLEILDLEEGEFEYFIPSGLGKLKLPINCSVDSSGNLYIADVKRRQIVVFNSNLEYVTSFGKAKNFKPTDVVVTRDNVWVSNIINGTIDVYKNDSTYAFLYSFPEKGVEKGKLFQPTNLFVTNDKVFVSDFGEFNIKAFDHQGNHLSTIGNYGKNLGQFARPKGVAADKDNNLFVVDAAFENVQIFDKDGKLLMFFGGSYRGHGGMWLPAKVSISYENNDYFQKYVDKRYLLKYVILVTNNFGPDKISVYGRIDAKSDFK
jgi:DNA-binding beta-propeller fold protein YncE